MTSKSLSLSALLMIGFSLGLMMISPAQAEAPHVYAIQGIRIVTGAGPVIEKGVLIIKGGLVEEVGTTMAIPPEAALIDGKGLTAYPGLIDMANSSGLDITAAAPPREAKTRMETERTYRQALLRPQLEAAALIKAEMPEWKKLALQGITSILAIPAGGGIQGCSSLVNTAIPEDPPQIGNVADERRGLFVVRTPVALHVSFPGRSSLGVYPGSLMGAMAFIRQAFLDAGHYRQEWEHYERSKGGESRPVYDAALEALQPSLEKKLPIIFAASSAVEIHRVLTFTREFGLTPAILGGHGADKVIEELREPKVRVLFSLNYPVRSKSLAPDADESLRELRERSNVPKVPAILNQAGILFAFASDGLKDPKEFLRNAARAVKAGLPPDAALRALTLDAASIAGVGQRLGSIEKGKIANLLLVDGDLFEEKTKLRHVFIDGRPVQADTTEAPAPSRRSSAIEN